MPFLVVKPRSTALLLGLVLGLGALAVGCDAGAARKPDKGGGGELRVVMTTAPTVLDPNSSEEGGMLSLSPNLFNKLVTLDSDLHLLSDLAERWAESDGGLTYTFELRRGVRWHDGRPFTAEDVRWTFERLAARPATLAREAVRRIARIETDGDHRVIFHLREPWAPFLATLAWEGAYILPHHSPEPSSPGYRPIGTGPFRWREPEAGGAITLEANLHYFRPGPYLDRVSFRVVPDFAAASRLLGAGEADLFVGRTALSEVSWLERQPQLRIVTAPSSSRLYVGFNLRLPVFQDARVREALNRALDRRQLVQRALLGYGTPAQGFYTPAVGWAYNPKARIPALDRQRAAGLLDAAGLVPGPQGVRLRLRLLAPDQPPFPDVAREIQAQLAPLGIEIVPQILPTGEWIRRTLRQHDFDLSLMSGLQGPDPESLNARFGTRGHSQFMGYSSPELDAAVLEGAGTAELSRRAQAYFRAQEILARDLPIAPLAEGVHVSVHRRSVRGLAQAEARGLVAAHDYSLVRLIPAGGDS